MECSRAWRASLLFCVAWVRRNASGRRGVGVVVCGRREEGLFGSWWVGGQRQSLLSIQRGREVCVGVGVEREGVELS